MPYIFVDELPDETQEADVVTKEEYNQLQQQCEDLAKQRDEAIERAVVAEDGWNKSRQKYADAFLSTPNRIKDEEAHEPINLTAQDIESLFKIG